MGKGGQARRAGQTRQHLVGKERGTSPSGIVKTASHGVVTLSPDRNRPYVLCMSSLVWLGLTVFLVAIVALTGAGPRGGKPVARTRLMGTARLVLIGGILLCAAFGVMGLLRH